MTDAPGVAAVAPVIALEGVTKQFGLRAGIFDVSFSIEPGELVVLLGPSGAGKSTLFRCITGLLRPDAGRIDVLGTDMTRLRGAAMRAARRAIGLIFQQFNLISRLSAINNVLAGRLGHVSTWRVLLQSFTPADRQRALAALDRVGLLEQAYQRADSLSGGQQQRVAIARVLAQESRIILADEPVSSLDPDSAHNVLTILRDIARERGIGVLCSLHQVTFAQDYADRIIGLRQGHVCVDVRAEDFDERHMAAIYGELVAARTARARLRQP
jgi:phosphonate transport system ATP-binding protein